MKLSSEGTGSGLESDDDSDRELQLAFEKGLLKSSGLNYSVPLKRQPINNVTRLEWKLKEFKRDSLPWIERLDVSVKSQTDKVTEIAEDPTPSSSTTDDDDFQRELGFYRQAQAAVGLAIPKLHKLGLPTKRPDDYFAEMAKSDSHMKKVREKLLSLQLAKQKQEAAKRLREEKKFASKVQNEVLLARQQEKRKLLEAVKKHRKGMKDQLEDVLENRKERQQESRGPEPKKKGGKVSSLNKKRTYKEKKFGFGGQKKRGKYNTKDSAGDVSMFSSRQHSKPAKGGGAKKRLGKGRRQKMKGRKKK